VRTGEDVEGGNRGIISGSILTSVGRHWGNPRKTSALTVGVPIESRTGWRLPNVSQKHYCFSQLAPFYSYNFLFNNHNHLSIRLYRTYPVWNGMLQPGRSRVRVPMRWIFFSIYLPWYSGQSSWLQIQRSGFDSLRYQISWEVVSLERDSLSLVSTIEELLGRNSSGSGLENREYGRGDSLGWPRDTLYPQKLALTSPTCGCRSVGIVRLRSN
jgi:hypothetical protein